MQFLFSEHLEGNSYDFLFPKTKKFILQCVVSFKLITPSPSHWGNIQVFRIIPWLEADVLLNCIFRPCIEHQSRFLIPSGCKFDFTMNGSFSICHLFPTSLRANTSMLDFYMDIGIYDFQFLFSDNL